MSTKMQYRHFASVESILGSGIKLVPESQYRMPRLHLSPCFALRCWKLLKWDLSFWYFWYFWVVDIVLATSNQLPAQQAPRRMALGCQLACSKELKSVPEAGTLEKKKLDRPCVATRIQRLRYAWRLHSKFQLGQQRFQQEGLGTGPVPREPCLSPKIGGPQSVFFRGETNGFVGASSIQISATFLPFFLHHVEVAMVQSCTREWFISRSTTETNESGYNSGPQLIIAHYGGKYSRTGFKNQICLWLQIATKLCPCQLLIIGYHRPIPENMENMENSAKGLRSSDLFGRLRMRLAQMTFFQTARQLLGDLAVSRFQNSPSFMGKTGGLSIEVSDFTTKTKEKWWFKYLRTAMPKG